MEGNVGRETLICNRSYGEDAGFHLQYKVICTDDPDPQLGTYDKVYSILIIKNESLDEREYLFIYDVSRVPERAGEIAEIM